MKSYYKTHLAGTALALVLASGQAFPQAPTTPEFVTLQPANEWLASLFVGQDVTNPAGERIGDINDMLFDKSGRISTVVIGVGGVLGIGGKHVAIPFSALTITSGGSGERVVTVPLSKAALETAPDFKPSEKTTFMKAQEKAGEIKDQLSKKIEAMRRDEPKKQ